METEHARDVNDFCQIHREFCSWVGAEVSELTKQYSELAIAVEIAGDALAEASEHAGETGEGWNKVTTLTTEYDAARAKYDAFNTAHPEYEATREAQRRKETEEALDRARHD